MLYLSGVSSHNWPPLFEGRPAAVLEKRGSLLPQAVHDVLSCHDLCAQVTDDTQDLLSLSETKQHKKRPRLLEAHVRLGKIWFPMVAMIGHRGIWTKDGTRP